MGRGCIQVIKLYADEHRFTFVFVFTQNASKPTNNVRKMVRGSKRSKAPIRATILSIILFTNLYYNNYNWHVINIFLFQCFCQGNITLEENIVVDGYIDTKQKKLVKMQRERERERNAQLLHDIWCESVIFDQFSSRGYIFDIRVLHGERPYGEEQRERNEKRKSREIHREYIDKWGDLVDLVLLHTSGYNDAFRLRELFDEEEHWNTHTHIHTYICKHMYIHTQYKYVKKNKK